MYSPVYVVEVISYVTLCWLRDCYRLHAYCCSGSLADFLTRKDLADFLLEALLDFLAVSFAYAVCNILSYLNIKKLAKFMDYLYMWLKS
jgi:hypothetical protein